MADADRARFDRTNDALDALASSAQPPSVDPTLHDTVRRLRALDAAEPLDPARIAHIWEVLMADAISFDTPGSIRPTASPISRNGAKPPLARPPAGGAVERARPAGAMIWLAAAVLLLVLTGAAGYQVFGPGFHHPHRHQTIPAAVVHATPSAEASPAPGMRVESLVDITIPASALPAGIAGSGLASYTLAPGLHTTWTTPSLAMLTYVVDGELTVRPVNQAHLKRAGSQTWQVSPGGTEFALKPGDLMYLLDPVDADYANLGGGIVRFLQWGASAGNGSDPPFPPEWGVEIYDLSGAGAVVFPGSDVRLRFLRIDLETKATLPSAATPILQLVINLPRNSAGQSQSPLLSRAPDGSITSYGARPATIYVIRLDPIGGPASPIAGTPLAATPEP